MFAGVRCEISELGTAFASIAEQHLANELRLTLAGIPIGAAITGSESFRAVLTSLEYFIPEMLREVHADWQHESLDGVFPEMARKTGENEIEISGTCILISDQTMTPIHVLLRIAADDNEIEFLDCKLGETGPNGMIRVPYGSNRVGKIAVSGRLDKINWVYHVGFGER
jgi:hypothetical protein